MNHIIGESDIIVIGAGMTGLLTALFLQQRGRDVLVLEGDGIASGQTGRTTAKITSQHGLFYDKLVRNVGREAALLYARANEEAIGEYADLIERMEIACDFKRLPAYLYSTDNVSILQKEAETAESLGLPAGFVNQVELPFETVGAVCFANQAQFQPHKFVEAIAGKLRIQEHTLVKKVKGNTIYTNQGVYRAGKIIFATHYPIVDISGFYFLRQHQERSYVLALGKCEELPGMYYSVDKGGLSLRSHGDILLLGGESHRTGKNQTGGAYAALQEAAGRYFPNGREVGRWSAQDCMPHDELPFIGRYFYGCRDWYVATGYKKWGMTSAMVAAKILTDMLSGVENPYAPLFTPQRHHIKAAFPNFLEDVGESICGLSAGWIPGLRHRTEVIYHKASREMGNPWRFCVVQDQKGENVSRTVKTPRCAHLGCKLTWNPDEESWDCPCHGSRYDKDGKLLDEPACKNLQEKRDK